VKKSTSRRIAIVGVVSAFRELVGVRAGGRPELDALHDAGRLRRMEFVAATQRRIHIRNEDRTPTCPGPRSRST